MYIFFSLISLKVIESEVSTLRLNPAAQDIIAMRWKI